MTRKLWIELRLGGWGILLFSIIVQTIQFIVPFPNEWMMRLLNGLLGSIATFWVMMGYFMLVRDELG
jgi:hypothetical protein